MKLKKPILQLDESLFVNLQEPSPLSPQGQVSAGGQLSLNGEATLHSGGVSFLDGRTIELKLEDLDRLELLGEGQYGSVYRVLHKPSNKVMGMF